MSTTFSDLKTEIARLGGLGSSDDDTDSAAAWGKGGLRMIGRAGAWPWLRRTISVTLVADQYNYDLADIASDLWRIDTKSLRTGGFNSYLDWNIIEAIDHELGPDWKNSSTDSGTPEYACRFGTELWIAGKPSSTFVSSNPRLYGYGWRYENWDEDSSVNNGNLLIPDVFFEIAVEASLAYGFTEEDDPRANDCLMRARQMIREEMMGAKLDVGADDRMFPPDWAYHSWAALDDYGDGGRIN